MWVSFKKTKRQKGERDGRKRVSCSKREGGGVREMKCVCDIGLVSAALCMYVSNVRICKCRGFRCKCLCVCTNGRLYFFQMQTCMFKIVEVRKGRKEEEEGRKGRK